MLAPLLLAIILFGLPLYAFGQYNGLTVMSGARPSIAACRNDCWCCCWRVSCVAAAADAAPQQLDSLVVAAHCIHSQLAALRDLLLNLRHSAQAAVRVAIYGAGEAGAQLAAALRLAGNHRIVTFLDDNPAYWDRSINGVAIQPPQKLIELGDSIDQVLLAIPSLSRRERRRIVDQLQGRGIPVLQVPSVDDLTSGRARIDALRPIAIEDLLGRDEVPPDPQLLGPGIRDAVVCVTGAGGSIGSELCRQILALSPARLILLERSEPALLCHRAGLVPLVPDGVVLSQCWAVRPIRSCCSACSRSGGAAGVPCGCLQHPWWRPIPWPVWPTTWVHRSGVSRRSRRRRGSGGLISTDKAVRPTNVMGASKRLAELVVQAHAAGGHQHAFVDGAGNVLGSSGSVVPLFRRQIAGGA